MSLIDDARNAAKRFGVNPDIFVKQIEAESGFNPLARSPAGAEGIAQFMPGTAAGLGINPWDPQQALTAAAQYDANNLRQYGGNYAKTLAAYNAGGGAVNTAIARGGKNWQNYLPYETRNYIRTILGGKPPTSAPSFAPSPTPVVHAHPAGIHEAHHTDGFGQPYAFSVPAQSGRPQPLFQQPQAFSVAKQPSTPIRQPKATRPQPVPAPKRFRGIS